MVVGLCNILALRTRYTRVCLIVLLTAWQFDPFELCLPKSFLTNARLGRVREYRIGFTFPSCGDFGNSRKAVREMGTKYLPCPLCGRPTDLPCAPCTQYFPASHLAHYIAAFDRHGRILNGRCITSLQYESSLLGSQTTGTKKSNLICVQASRKRPTNIVLKCFQNCRERLRELLSAILLIRPR